MDTAQNPCPVCRSPRASLEARCETCGWSPEPTPSPTDPSHAPSDEPMDEQLLWKWTARAAIVGVGGAAIYAFISGDTQRLMNRLGGILVFGTLFLLFVSVLWVLRFLSR